MNPNIPQKKEGVLFLNHAAISPIAPAVAQASIASLTAQTSGAPAIDTWVGTMEKARGLVAKLINGEKSSIGFMQNTSQAISVVAEGLSWAPGDEVLVPAIEYPANQYPWINLERKGVVVKRAEPLNGEIDIKWLEKNITDKTRLVAFSHIQYNSGYRANVKEITSFCKAKGILTLVDAIQSFGAFEVDVTDWDVDFCAFGSQKWLMAPPGISVLYIRPALVDEIHPVMTGMFSVAKPFEMYDLDLTFNKKAKRIESGTMSFQLFPAFLKALEIVEETGVETITKALKERREFLYRVLSEKGYTLISPESFEKGSSIITFTANEEKINSLWGKLTKAGVIATLRGTGIRFAPHYYTEMEDLKELAALL